MVSLEKQTRYLGGNVTDQYKPHLLVNHPPAPQDVTLELLMASQAHLGHATGLWHPGNARYIYGVRDGIHIISLDVTASHLRRACKIVQETASQGGLILFAGTRSGQERSVVKAAELAGGCHLFDRWIPGSITNGIQILGNCRTKVVNHLDKDVSGYEGQLMLHGPVKPDLVVVLNPLENHVLLRECNQHNIPTIGVVDTDCNPALVTYPIPANDDSRRCTNVIAGVLGRAAQAGRAERLIYAEGFREGPYERRHRLRVLDDGGNEESEAAEAADPELEVRKAEAQEEDLNPDENVLLEEAKHEAEEQVAQEELEDAESLDEEASDDPRLRSQEAAQDERTKAAFEMFSFSDWQDGEEFLLPTEQEVASRDQLAQEHDSMKAKKSQQAGDPMLRRLIAMKRRALGEELSAEDQQELHEVEKSEAAVRADVEKTRKELLDEIDVEKDAFLKEAKVEAVEADEEAQEELEAASQERETRRREDQTSYGPVTKNRRGRG
ncbi:ribosomal protein S2 [Myriangium duriaei CBS 260.36]|uniref:Ribosomal protein S2 n=1 Tax=Myriangium duriaei CBS 260.36 TaxID=1168546 RepID=A0A9P4IXV6_9PEZI|nr:ribosomal protein S2 [Myriangium duriaei CBS 260.36]